MKENGKNLETSSSRHINFSRLDQPELIQHIKNVLDRICGPRVGFIVFIISSPQNLKERETHRRAVSYTPNTFKLKILEMEGVKNYCHLYSVGYSNNATVNELVNLESIQYGDVLRIPVLESYYNLPKKVIITLSLLNRFKERFDYVLKTDDDLIVLTKLLIINVNQRFKDYDLIGYIKHGAMAIRDQQSKFYVSIDEHINDFYLSYPQGGGYVIKSEVIEKIVNQFNISPYIKYEDVMMGQMMIDLRLRVKHFERLQLCDHDPLRPCTGHFIIGVSIDTPHREDVLRGYQLLHS
ncbi:Beta-1,3-galactosyltransferase 5 [Thelohanellus kitauei]|uniref:Hexosyltransferase n=1 Tax=Thelohanellus kitauei TaxID=669202 RepID=A0A0C2IQI6_THEKT|nr:Beta-1,3-galactosyltransferase 5 [Thelohanellus kitauei]